MAARKQLWHPDEVRFYVYAITDASGVVLYVGKGSGRRSQQSARKRGGVAVILSRHAKEADAFKAEIQAIADLKPTENVCRGGNGGRAVKVIRRRSKDEIEMDLIGTRAFAARGLLRKLDERNAHLFGLSKVDISRWRQVAGG